MTLAGPHRLLAHQKVRFALAGAFNTVLGYGVFVVLELAVGGRLPYLVVLLASYIFGVSEAFVLHRFLVFQDRTPWLPAYLRFWCVYLVSLGVNVALLPVLVELLGLPVLVAQPLVLLVVALGSFIGHSRFSFRSSKQPAYSRG